MSLYACRPATFRGADIEATEYAYRAPAEIDPGLVAFRFINHGTVPHEVQLFRFNPGTTLAVANSYLAKGSVPDCAADAAGNVLIANPGLTAPERVLIHAKSGELYALICQFRDGPGKPPHANLRMVGVIRVGDRRR
ncbi:MAG: hypothetical protein ABI408_10915 [Gemmatimonadaceae bacterium]